MRGISAKFTALYSCGLFGSVRSTTEQGTQQNGYSALVREVTLDRKRVIACWQSIISQATAVQRRFQRRLLSTKTERKTVGVRTPAEETEGGCCVRYALPHPAHPIISPHVPTLQSRASQRTDSCYSGRNHKLSGESTLLPCSSCTTIPSVFLCQCIKAYADRPLKSIRHGILNMVLLLEETRNSTTLTQNHWVSGLCAWSGILKTQHFGFSVAVFR